MTAVATGHFDLLTHHQQEARSRQSADVVLPIVLKLTGAQSVIDVGCGIGHWLAAARALGITDGLGLDGWYALEGLQIPREDFQPADFQQPLRLDRTYDLAICVEVAEHLPPEVGPRFVQDLTQLAPYVLFSAAIPGQGGHGHINERPQSYWAGLFAEHGYLCSDAIRPRIWYDERVEWWYRQNVLLMMRADLEDAEYRTPALLDVVHPGLLARALAPKTIGGREALTLLLQSVMRRFRV